MKILIIRLSAIGDIAMASGIVPALKKKYPDASIDWLVQTEYKQLLLNTKQINNLIGWDRSRWQYLFNKKKVFELIKEIKAFIKELRLKRYDMVIDLQGLWKSVIWLWLCKAKKKIGVEPKEIMCNWVMNEVFYPEKSKDIASEYKYLLKRLGAYNGSYSLGIDISEEDKKNSDLLLEEVGLGQEKFIVISPFTTRDQKHWPDEYWFELLDKIEEKVVLLGGKGDKKKAQLFEKRCKRLVNLAGRTTIRESIRIIQRSCFLIGVDTGLTHIAMLSNIPTIALFGATCPYITVDNPKGVVLYHRLECSPCKRTPTCKGDFTCMRLITPLKVFEMYKKVRLFL